MKQYDFEKAKTIIESMKEHIESAGLGMHEDWFWTADTVFENDEFTKDLTEIDRISFIRGSEWATPVLWIEYKNGAEEVYECFVGESNVHDRFSSMIQEGPFSREAQSRIPEIKTWKEEQ